MIEHKYLFPFMFTSFTLLQPFLYVDVNASLPPAELPASGNGPLPFLYLGGSYLSCFSPPLSF